jgi:anti-sigma regulatory factor (Ser/Thr protein kinase)
VRHAGRPRLTARQARAPAPALPFPQQPAPAAITRELPRRSAPGAAPGTDAMRTGIALLGSLTVPGRPDQATVARAFARQAIGELHPCAGTAVLLVSEVVTNSIIHSNSRRDGGTITITVIAVGHGIRVEVIDAGSATVPALRTCDDELAMGGRGLQLLDDLSARWDFCQDAAGTVTWFELSEPPDE